MTEETGLKKFFGTNLAILLADKIIQVYPSFETNKFTKDVTRSVGNLELIDRTILIAEQLKKYLPKDYKKSLEILGRIFGPENEKETGMFTTGYWLWPVAKFIELYGVEYFKESMSAIYEITKRHTGEYAIRPYLNKYPDKSLKLITKWAKDKNVHVRRLASEGIRPLLPWSQKLNLFIEDPNPVFRILELLKDDDSKFVQKSVANNIGDYLKVNFNAALKLLNRWKVKPTPQRVWVIKHSLRNQLKKKNPQALKLLDELSN